MKYMIWVICYLVFALIFSQGFKKVNRTMKNASALTVLLELFTGLFAIVMSIFFKYTFPSDIKVYITLFVVTIIYAVTDRLNIEARYGLSPSNFSMLKQLSTVFLVISSVTMPVIPITRSKLVDACLGLIHFANIGLVVINNIIPNITNTAN